MSRKRHSDLSVIDGCQGAGVPSGAISVAATDLGGSPDVATPCDLRNDTNLV